MDHTVWSKLSQPTSGEKHAVNAYSFRTNALRDNSLPSQIRDHLWSPSGVLFPPPFRNPQNPSMNVGITPCKWNPQFYFYTHLVNTFPLCSFLRRMSRHPSLSILDSRPVSSYKFHPFSFLFCCHGCHALYCRAVVLSEFGINILVHHNTTLIAPLNKMAKKNLGK